MLVGEVMGDVVSFSLHVFLCVVLCLLYIFWFRWLTIFPLRATRLRYPSRTHFLKIGQRLSAVLETH